MSDMKTNHAEQPETSRRHFLDWILKGGFLATLLGMFLPALTYLWPVTRRGPVGGMVEVGREDDLAVWGAKKISIGESPMILLRTPQSFKAYSAVCTHLGCLVEWSADKRLIECPCHAGFFDVEGRVISGPPPKSLVGHTVRVVDGKIFVKL